MLDVPHTTTYNNIFDVGFFFFQKYEKVFLLSFLITKCFF
jgi:hypothetical protein